MSQLWLLFLNAVLNLIVAVLAHLIMRWIDKH